jgi:hypothetical protein
MIRLGGIVVDRSAAQLNTLFVAVWVCSECVCWCVGVGVFLTFWCDAHLEGIPGL